MLGGRLRTVDRGFVIEHRWQGPRIGASRHLAPDRLAASDRRSSLSVELLIAND